MSNLTLVPDSVAPLDDPNVCADLVVRELLAAETETEPLVKLARFAQAVALAHVYRAAKAKQRIEGDC